VLRNAGPKSASGMPEAGYLPIPKKLARQGVKDMVRVSDARMSGTAFGTIVLHVTPEATVGGPLSIVRTGDRIRLSVAERRIDLLVDDAEIAARLAAKAPAPSAEATPAAGLAAAAAPSRRGYDLLYRTHVLQADRGCDFDFLRGDPA
ncbi:partial 6-deoxy-6-sulfo-D-gluconate dehydratase, partial [Gammaproteobacteria bacterium]